MTKHNIPSRLNPPTGETKVYNIHQHFADPDNRSHIIGTILLPCTFPCHRLLLKISYKKSNTIDRPRNQNRTSVSTAAFATMRPKKRFDYDLRLKSVRIIFCLIGLVDLSVIGDVLSSVLRLANC